MLHPQVYLPPGPPMPRQAGSCRRDRDAFADHCDTAVGDVEAASFVSVGINPYGCAVRNDNVLVQDRARNHGVMPDGHVGQDHRVIDFGTLVNCDVG